MRWIHGGGFPLARFEDWFGGFFAFWKKREKQNTAKEGHVEADCGFDKSGGGNGPSLNVHVMTTSRIESQWL